MGKLQKNICYWIEFLFSWIYYRISVLFFKFQDYLDYLEVVRFQLWHSVVSIDSRDSWSLKVAKFGYKSPHVWVTTPYFTKVRIRFKEFAPIRGIAWDRGTDVNSLEASLIQSEHYLSVEKVVNRSNFQEYVFENRPRRLALHRKKSKNPSLNPGITAWSHFISGSQFVLGILYVVFFTICSLAFTFFELSYLLICLWVLRAKSKFIFPIIERKFFNSTKSWKISIVVLKIVRFFFFPIFYFGYVSSVFLYVLFYGTYILIISNYIFISRYLFKVGLRVLKFFYKFKFQIYESKIKPYLNFYYFGWVLILKLITFVGYIWRSVIYFNFRHKYITFFERILLILLRIEIVLDSFLYIFHYFNLGIPFLWVTNYFIPIVVCLGYEGLASPVYFSVLVIFALPVLFPYVRKLMKLPDAIIRNRRSISYADRKFVSELSPKFYKALSYEPLPRGMGRWPLAREVLASKYMNKEETRGSDTDPTRDLAYQLKQSSASTSDRLNILATYVQEARADLFANSILGPSGRVAPETGGLDKKYARMANMDTRFKYRPDEFRLFQSHLTRLYYLISSKGPSFSTIVARVLFNYRTNYCPTIEGKSVLSFHNPQDPYEYESSLTFTANAANLYFLRVSEFSKVAKSRYFFLRKSSKFAPRPILVNFFELSSTVRKCLDKLANAQFFPTWDANCLTTSGQWLCTPRVHHTRRSFSDFQNFFNSPSIDKDNPFQFNFYSFIDRHNRNSFVNISSYIQLLYDFYWIFRLNTNIFMSYSFGSHFYFSIGVGLPNWLFVNSVLSPIRYPSYQDDTGSILSHILLYPGVRSTGNFADVLLRLSKFGGNHYNRYLLEHVGKCFISCGANININVLLTFSDEFYHWADNICFESVEKDRIEINKAVEQYLFIETSVINEKASGYLKNLVVNYAKQSFYSTYLHSKVSVGFSRFAIKDKDKMGGLWTDLKGVFKHMAFVSFLADQVAYHESENFEGAQAFEGLHLEKQKLIDRLKTGFRNFPSLRAGGVQKMYCLFVGGSYIYAAYFKYSYDMRTVLGIGDEKFPPKEFEELWSIFMDFFTFVIDWLL